MNVAHPGGAPRDVAGTRLDNALLLFDEFVKSTIKHPDAATLRGLEGRFAERLHIQPSYWSQIKSRSRQIGERLARQFERLCHKPHGWMDEAHAPARALDVPRDQDALHATPQDDDERFVVGLVLTYYRRHPQRARTRLLDLLGEALAPAPGETPSATGAMGTPAPGGPGTRGKAGAVADDRELWSRTRSAIAPLKRKR